MVSVLICTHSELEKDLGHTLLWRQDVDRHVATRLEEALMMALAAHPSIVVVDRDLPWAGRLVTALREDPSTRGLSIVVIARGDFDPGEVELLESGANAILRVPLEFEKRSREGIPAGSVPRRPSVPVFHSVTDDRAIAEGYFNATSIGVTDRLWVPMPSWPRELSPQQLIAPPLSTQLNAAPPSTIDAVPSPGTSSIGISIRCQEPTPASPSALSPKHSTQPKPFDVPLAHE